MHFGIQSTIMRSWALKGSKPQVKSYAGRKNASYSGFVTPEDGRLFVARPFWFNWETTVQSLREFISHLPPGDGRRIICVLDNAPWHKKAVRLVQTEALPEYQDIRDRMTLVSLPPYSPDLNPIEQVWRITRREKTHNRFWENFQALSSTLDDWFDSLSVPNEKIKTLCSFKP